MTELRDLLLEEIRKRISPLEQAPADTEAALLAAVTLRGSAGLAGEPNLASALGRLEPRLRDGDRAAIQATISLLRNAVTRLDEGEPALGGSWPVPPPDLEPREIEAYVRVHYDAEVKDRLAGLDQCLAATGEPIDIARVAFRHVHTMKGAASAVGDEPMSWFCHGLEDRLRDIGDEASARTAMVEVGQYRGILGGLAEDATGTLRRLRGEVEVTLPSHEEREGRNTDPAPPPDVSSRPDPEDEETVRVDARAVTQLIPHVENLAAFREAITAHGRRARDLGRRVRQTRTDVHDSDGADTERNLGALADELETIANELRESADRFGGDVLAAKRQVSGILLTTMGTVFARIVGVVDAEARRLSRQVKTRAAGVEEPVDRRLAERLVEPCVQIARNAVAHGIQSPEQRRAVGKDPSGTITLTAKRVGTRLQVTIADDGGGVDLSRVREHAVATGVLEADRAATADDALLLSLLLRPGFTTQSSPDLLAGRGIGLDIALHGIQRLGGSLRLLSRRGQGFSARIEFPVEAALGGVRIEPLKETDIESAATIVEPAAGRDELIVPARGLPEARRLASQTRLREELARPWARVRIARALTGELLGVLVAWHVADEVHVLDVVTDARARRRGIGRALMNDLLTFARALPVRHLLLEVRRSNTPAIQLYRTLGFFATNVRKRYYDDGEDALEMRLVFDEAREVVFAPDEFPVEAP